MFDGRDPMYVQIADQIRTDVLTGALREEEQVMSTTQYATTYRINPATAAKAFAELVDEGVLYKRRGIGMFVAEGARERLLAQRRASSSPTSSSRCSSRRACWASAPTRSSTRLRQTEGPR